MAYNLILPNPIMDAMLLSSSLAEPDPVTSETAWSPTEIVATGDLRYIGAPTLAVTISIGTPAVITWASNGLAIDTPVVFSTTGALPTGLTAGKTYYVAGILTTGTFTVSDSIGGRAISTSGTQSGTHTAVAKVHRIYQCAIGQKSTVTITIATPGVVTYTAHGLAADTAVVFTSTGALPTGITAGVTYYVRSPTTDTFQLATAAGGSSIATSGTQSGTHTCGLAVTYNKPPALYTEEANATTIVWVDAGPTNLWAVFDESLTTASQANNTLKYVLQPGRFNALGFKGVNSGTLYVDFQISRATVTITQASPGVVTYNAHGFAADTPVILDTTGTLPAPLQPQTVYFVRNPTTNTFQLALTAGGASINTTSAGSGTHTLGQKIYQYSVDLNSGVKVGNWYDFFNLPIIQQDTAAVTQVLDAALFNLATYQQGVLTVIAARTSGTVSIAAMVIGMSTAIGELLPGPMWQFVDYSTKDANPFGDVKITRRPYSDQPDVYVRVDKDNVDNVVQLLHAYRARAVMGVDDAGLYGCLNSYGFISAGSAPIAPKEDPLHSVFQLTWEGLTAD